MFYTRILSTLLLTCTVATSNGQLFSDTTILKPLPRITQWADNNHYILKRYNSENRKDENFTVDIRSGTEKPIKIPGSQQVVKVEITDGDLQLLTGNEKKRLTQTGEVEKLPVLSPDNKWVAFLRNNDLYALDLSSGREIRFTNDGAETILNGYASWVYYEEILGRSSNYRAFWWSPDSKHIAFYRFDDSVVPIYPLYNSSGQHGFTEKTRYPKAGDPNPEARLGIASIDDGNVKWADFNEKADQYFGTPFWSQDGSRLIVQWMPREQDNLKMFEISTATGTKNEIYTETQPTWISWIDKIHWVKDGFLIIRDFDGWEQIYYHATNGKLKKKLTYGKNWRTRIEHIDEKTQTVYYSANAEISTRKDLYSVRLDDSGQKRLTFGEYSFSNFLISPDGQYLITNYSNSTTPPRIALINLKSGSTKNLADSKGSNFDNALMSKREIVWLTTEDGIRLPGRITWPAAMEVNKKYPVIINIYGGPNYQAVTDTWVNSTPEDDKEPVIRVGFAHRGSGDLGKAGLNYLHRNLGRWEMHDYIEWAKWLIKNPSVNADKVMITGGSYGGYLTALALTYGAEYFKYGISNYPVTDWKLYDSHYTERYMDQPKDNPEGYKFGSVMAHANNYQKFGPSMLLIQHGTMDDNVHIQNTYQLADTLQRLNKTFEIMVYPGERHGWIGPKSRFTVRVRGDFQQRYLFDKE